MSKSRKIVLEDGITKYRNWKGELHRVDGPAKIWADGRQEWWVKGLRHRDDGPAVICSDGGQEWYVNGIRHREDGPACIYSDGSQKWYKNGELHRDDGPAAIWPNGSQEWRINGVRHRVDGPAEIWADGRQEWRLLNIKVTEELVKNLDSLTADLIHQQHNTELRAWLINRMGWVNYLREINAQPIDSRHNDIENTKEALYQIENQKQLLVTCPTGRVFSLHVPDRIETCEQAQYWLGNDTKKKYNVIGRT